MTIKNISRLTAVVATALTLSACHHTDELRLQVASMSCTDLAREIGRYTQMRDDAAIDSLSASIDGLITKKKNERIASGIEAVAEDITEMMAREKLDVLNVEYARRGCR